MKKLFALIVATGLLPGCFTATGAVIGHEVAKHQTPYDDNSALEAGIAFGVAADVVTSVLLVSAIASASPEGQLLPGPGEGGGGAFR